MWGGVMACAVCHTTENLQRCGQCRMIVYCGVEHQRAHWPVHSQTCLTYPVSMENWSAQSGAGAAAGMDTQPAAPNPPAIPQVGREAAHQDVPAQPDQPIQPPAQTSTSDADSVKPNQKTLDGRSIFLPQGVAEPEKLSMSNLPSRGSGVSMEEGSNKRARSGNEENIEPQPKKRRGRKKVEVPVVQAPIREPTPPEEEDYILETLWKTTLGMLVFREDKGYYGDGPDFDWQQGTKYLTDVKTKRTKGSKPVTEKWGKWQWDEKVWGPNNYGRFKIRIAHNGESFKGTWGWGSRNRGGGSWTGSFVEETKVPIAPVVEDKLEEMRNFAEEEKVDTIQAQDELDVALCHAAVAGEPDKISSLIGQGADVNNRLVEKCTPVMHAVVMDYPNVVRALLKAPVDLNAQDSQGCTPLHVCAEHGHVECAQVILEACDFELVAAEYAASLALSHPLRNQPRILAMIAAYASPLDISVKNDAGQGIFDLIECQEEIAPALKESRRRIAELVRDHLAKLNDLFNKTAASAPVEVPFTFSDPVMAKGEMYGAAELNPPTLPDESAAAQNEVQVESTNTECGPSSAVEDKAAESAELAAKAELATQAQLASQAQLAAQAAAESAVMGLV